jgi:CelD/BcsL family acetyltransferase involved in cellulose biosynthesis
MVLTVEWNEGKGSDRSIDEWSALVDRSPLATIFQTPEWVIPWRLHMDSGVPRDLAVRNGDRLVGLVPLAEKCEKEIGLPVKVMTLAGEPQSDRSGLLFDPEVPEVLDRIVHSLLDAARSVDMIRLSELETERPESRALIAASRSLGARISSKVCARAPILSLARPWSEIAAGIRPSNRSRLQRARKRQHAAGGFEFKRWQPEPEEIHELLPLLREIEDRSWKGGERLGIFSPLERWSFVNDFARRFAARRWLDVALLTQGGRPIAYRFGFRFRGVFHDYNLAHDPEAASFSPGRTLLDDVIQDSHRLGLLAVDASRGGLFNPHLLGDWTTEARWHRKWMIFGTSARGRMLAAIERHAKPLARRALRRNVEGIPE